MLTNAFQRITASLLFFCTLPTLAHAEGATGHMIISETKTETAFQGGVSESTHRITAAIRGSKAALDMVLRDKNGKIISHGATIHDIAAGTITYINHNNRTFIVSDKAAKGEGGEVSHDEDSDSDAGRPKLVNTGETMEIRGMVATKYEAQKEGWRWFFWLVDDPKGLELVEELRRMTRSPGSDSSLEVRPDTSSLPGPVVRIEIEQTLHPSAKTTHVIDSTYHLDIEIDPTLFSIPEGYTQKRYEKR